MEGLIPFVYRAVLEYRNGGGSSTWYSESPSTSYLRLPTGDSGRFSEVQLISSNSSMVVVTATSAVQSPLVSRPTSRQLASS
ncbi:hypothetical protein MKW92_011564 [Papaver armeniacum]|nr:hypothetical protein MKW92_011564 [Papaver armeniacum]